MQYLNFTVIILMISSLIGISIFLVFPTRVFLKNRTVKLKNKMAVVLALLGIVLLISSYFQPKVITSNYVPTPTVTEEITDQDAKIKFYEASGDYDDKDYQSVIDSLEPIVTKKPDLFKGSRTFSYAYLLLGNSFWKVEGSGKNPQKALTYLKLYLGQNFHTACRNSARINLAQVYKFLNQSDEAEKTLLDGVGENPDYNLFRNLGNFYSDRNYKKAFKYFGMALKLKPDDYWSYLGLSSLQIQNNLCPAAKESLQKAEDSYASTGDKDLGFEKILKANRKQFKSSCN